MNPQFARSKADKNAIRNEYIKNLQLETSNNLMNYNANKIFKESGALPPSITAQLDTRSITEKYADTQKARVAVIAGLREITDGANANEILDQIHGNEIITLLNNLPQIVADIKPKWSLGITAPAFMNYWNNYKQALTLNSGMTSLPILQSNQLLTNIQGILQNIQATIPTGEDYEKLKQIINLLPKTTKRGLAIKIIDDARKQADEIVAQANAFAQQKIGENDPILQQQRIALLGELTARLPNITALSQLTQEAQIASQLGRNVEGADEVFDSVINILQPEEDPVLQRLREEMSVLSAKSTPVNTPSRQEESEEEDEDEGDNDEGLTTSAAQSPSPFRPTSFQELMSGNWDFAKSYIMGLIKSGDINKKDINYDPNTYKGDKRPSGLTKGNIRETNLPELIDAYLTQKPSGKGLKRQMKGCGVSFAPKGTISNYARVDTSKKVEKTPSYIQFGKHLLHQHDLNGGILKIKRLSGTQINELPTQAIGGKLKKVLITLTGTGNPSFEDINELNEHEKNLLNKIVKNCKIDQRLLVPTPDKTKEEQLYNRLQILSGEIGSGNNNPQIVRELKTLLLKLKNSGRIPARHAHAILEELLSLGY
jgi:hypothetical protein